MTDIEDEEDQNCAGDEGSKRKLPTEVKAPGNEALNGETNEELNFDG